MGQPHLLDLLLGGWKINLNLGHSYAMCEGCLNHLKSKVKECSSNGAQVIHGQKARFEQGRRYHSHSRVPERGLCLNLKDQSCGVLHRAVDRPILLRIFNLDIDLGLDSRDTHVRQSLSTRLPRI